MDQTRAETGISKHEIEDIIGAKLWSTNEVLEKVGSQLDAIQSSLGTNDQTIAEIGTKLNRLEAEVSSLNNGLVEGRSLEPGPSSYAAVAGALPVRRVGRDVRSKDHVALVFPTGEETVKESGKTRDLIKDVIKPLEEKLKIRAVHAVRNGGIAIRLQDEESVQKILGKTELQERGYTVRKPVTREPLIKFRGVPSNTTEEEFYNALREQNLEEVAVEDLKANLAFRFKKGKRDLDTQVWVFSATPEMRKTLLDRGRVYIGWYSCGVADFVDVTRCMKCLGFGHIARVCHEKEDACSHCTTKGHKVKDCPNKEKPAECSNCKRVNKECGHGVFDNNCPALKFAIERAMRAINFNG